MKLLFSLLFVLSFGTIYAQTDFSGTYSINKSKIDFKTEIGQAPEYVLPTQFKVTQNGNLVTIIRTTVDEQGIVTDRTYIFNGNAPCDLVTAGGSKIHSSLQWSNDKTSFTLTTKLIATESTSSMNYTEVWSLIDGGKTLVIDRSVEQLGIGSKYTIKGFYKKQ